ncbi:hypothetical protein PHJA_000396600 [Phtheirospermum japonicum]|uniref:DUF1985 domain-containing protein n=1 Tax=Phtheirospermum japonicum TaxID=374723 RepID=A0A830B6D3_9LAMI|nr:hypothetical protein PHJA_000396600 [Phtheirospermum japonicum]
MRRIRLVLNEEYDMEAALATQGAPEDVQWTWKREALQTTTADITLYSKRVIVEQIAEELKLIGDWVYQEFLNSCFGFLMRFDTQGLCSKAALHWLFAHEVTKADAGPDELWYRVGGRFIRFSKYEYALVTGLSFGPTTFDPSAEHHPPASGLFLRHYRGRRLKMETLRRDFTDGVFRGSPADALKVAKLLIVYFLLFGMDGRQRYIDRWAWTLIEESDQWETFMWGQYTYQILLSCLQQVPTELLHSVTPSYRVYGYVWAFLIWAFEAIPAMGIACRVHASDDVHVLPRCLRWRFPKGRMAMDGFYDCQMEVHSTLEPSAEEQRQPYWEHIYDKPSAWSKATPNRRSHSAFANPIKFKKRKRTHPLTTQEKAHKKLSEHECGCRGEMTSVIQNEDSLSPRHTAAPQVARPRVQSRYLRSPITVFKHRKKDMSEVDYSRFLKNDETRYIERLRIGPDFFMDSELATSEEGATLEFPDDAENVVDLSPGVCLTSNSSGLSKKVAKYLIDSDKELRLTKSVSEVKKERPDVIGQCRKLATVYSEKLFQIYCAADDPFFGQS